MLNSEFIGATVAPCLSNTELIQEYFSEFLESIQFSEFDGTIQEFKKIKERAEKLKEEYEEEEDEETRELIVDEDYISILESLAPAFSSFSCTDVTGDYGFWPCFDEFIEEFPESLLDKIFPGDWKGFDEELKVKAKGYDFEKFTGKRIVYIQSLDALFVCRDGIFTKI